MQHANHTGERDECQAIHQKHGRIRKAERERKEAEVLHWVKITDNSLRRHRDERKSAVVAEQKYSLLSDRLGRGPVKLNRPVNILFG